MTDKADFRAIRETCGISQSVAARDLRVTERTVKRWEDPASEWQVPDDAMDYVDDAMDAHRRAVDESVDAAVQAAAITPVEPTVTLTYWRSQTQYDSLGRDPGDVGIINARSREVGGTSRRSWILRDLRVPRRGRDNHAGEPVLDAIRYD